MKRINIPALLVLGGCMATVGAFGSIYVNDMDYVLGDVKQAFIQNKISTQAQCDNLLIGFQKMGVNGIRVPIFAEGLDPNKPMFDYFFQQAVAQGFLIFANPAQSSGGQRIANGILNGDTTPVYDDPVATATLIHRIQDFAAEYPSKWINAFNEDGQAGAAWSADQMNQIYSTLHTNLNGAEQIGPGVWGIPASIQVLNNTDLSDYVTVATTHNLGFHHSRWSDFIAVADAANLPVWDSEVNHNDKYGTGTRLEAALANEVDGLVLYNSWNGINLSNGSVSAGNQTQMALYLKGGIPQPLPYAEGFEDGIGDWQQSNADDFDWSIGSGYTDTTNTGPSAAADGAQYLFTEGHDGGAYTMASVECSFDLGTVDRAALTFDYHMYGPYIDYLSLDVFDGSIWTSNVWKRSGQQQSDELDPWLEAVVDLSRFVGNRQVTLRFSAKNKRWNASDTAIDNIRVEESATPFAQWAASAFAGAPDGADLTATGNPDGDRFNNAMEWALNTDPLTADEPAMDVGTSNASFVAQYERRDPAATGIEVYAGWATSLTSTVWRLDGDGMTESSKGWSNDVETVLVELPLDHTNAFIRIQAEEQ